MNPYLTAGLVVIAIVVVIALIAFALYKAGFSVDKIKAKLPMFEMEASRKKDEATQTDNAAPAAGPKISQRAEDGGVISGSGISAPADAAADIDQQAKDRKSKIDDSPINLT